MASFSDINNIFFRLSLKEKMLFARHMDMMTRSGVQTLEALEILRRQTTNKSFIRVLDSLIADVKNGHYLSVSMERYRNVFGDFFINLVRVGETSGTLSENFKYLADELGKKAELNAKIRGATTYPIILFVMSIGMSAMMAFFIFPKILPVFKQFNADLPITTRVLIAVSTFAVNYGVWLFLGLFTLAVAFFLLIRIPKIRYVWHRFILMIPVVGRMSTEINIINMARTLSLLLRGGVKIVEALEITANTLANDVYRRQVQEVAQAVQRGEPMSKHLIENSKFFPPSFSQMAMVGENTGKLDETLVFLADFYEGELDSSTKSFGDVIEPFMLLLMGGLVAFVALSIVTPIWSITQSLNR
jgi:type II secretory pathway component PulF